jgi:trigger factor
LNYTREGRADGDLVGEARFELTTPCSQSRCATKLRHSPVRRGDASRPERWSRHLGAGRSCGSVRGDQYTASSVKSTVEPLEGNKVRLSVEVDESELEPAIDAAFQRIAREVRLPGFRPGKAPRKLLEARLGTGMAREEALREAVPGYYAEAVATHEVDVIAPPEIEITDGADAGPVAFDAVVEVRPTVNVAGYENLRVEIPAPVPTDADVEAHVDRLRDQYAELVTVERAAKDGDHVTIDIDGTRDGEPLEGYSAEGYVYEVGRGSNIPQIDENLRGASAGDTLEFTGDDHTHDEDDQPDHGPIEFVVRVDEVQEKVLPDLTDEWVAEASEVTSVDELRADLRDRLTRSRAAQAETAIRERTAAALAELLDIEPPEALVSSEMQNRVQDMAMRLQAQGIQLDQFLAMTGQTQASFVEGLRDTAHQAVLVDLALRAVADAEAIECTDDDLDAELTEVAQQVGQPADAVRDQFERGGQLAAVRSDIRKRKALDWLIERVEVVDEEGNPIDRAELQAAIDAAEAPTDDDTHDDTDEDEDEQ